MLDPLDGLNEAQAQAVTHLEGPALVIGGAGTGKSEALARRFAWLAAQGQSPDAILALSPSTTGAARLRARIEELLEPPWEELHVTTLPDFCCRLLRDEAHEAGPRPVLLAREPCRAAGAAARADRRPHAAHARDPRQPRAASSSGSSSGSTLLKSEMITADRYADYV